MSSTETDDETFVTRLLDESGVTASEPLHGALLELRAGNSGPVAAPSGELASLMAPNVTALRPRRKTRTAATVGIAVVAATGLGVSGVAAASPELRDAANGALQRVVQFFDPSQGETPSGGTGQTPEQDQSTDRTSGDGEPSQHVPGSPATPSPDGDSDAGRHVGTENGSGPAASEDAPDDAGDSSGEALQWGSAHPNLDLPRITGLPGKPSLPSDTDGLVDRRELVPKPGSPQPSDAPGVPDPGPTPADDPTNIPPLPDLKTP